MTEHSRLRYQRNPNAGLIHLLNQRYREEWQRAESLREELDCLRGSGFWKAVSWMRSLKQYFWPVNRPPEPTLAARSTPYCKPDGLGQPQGRVSIVIPFKDRLELLRNCLRSLNWSTYRNFEVILVDNGSAEPRTLRFLERASNRKRIAIVSHRGEFNFSRLCNAGAARATGDYICFLNNDTEVLCSSWLQALLCLAMDPGVGAVGATLLYPDRTIQHTGLFPRTDGLWVHPHRGFPEATLDREGALSAIRAVPAVTAACLLLRRATFVEFGGFDERYPVTHNDVDLCERLRSQGLLVLVSPHARLIHYEGLSRDANSDTVSGTAKVPGDKPPQSPSLPHPPRASTLTPRSGEPICPADRSM